MKSNENKHELMEANLHEHIENKGFVIPETFISRSDSYQENKKLISLKPEVKNIDEEIKHIERSKDIVDINVLTNPFYYTSVIDEENSGMFWDGTYGINYSYALTSAYFFLERRKQLSDKFKNACEIIGDSGGFQAITLGQTKLDPMIVLRWQENNVNIALGLDIPPYATPESALAGGVTDEILNNSLKISNENYIKAWSNRENEKMKLIFPVHGTDYGQLRRWFETITKEYKPDGFALAPKQGGDPMLIALNCMVANEYLHDGDILHFLAITGMSSVVPIYYFTHLLKKNNRNIKVTLDSSTPYLRAKQMRCWFDPFVFGSDFRVGVHAHNPIESFPCRCPVCARYSFKEIISDNSYIAGDKVGGHNLYYLVMFLKYLEETVKTIGGKGRQGDPDEDLFARYVRKRAEPEVQRAIDFMREASETSLEHAYPKYFEDASALHKFF